MGGDTPSSCSSIQTCGCVSVTSQRRHRGQTCCGNRSLQMNWMYVFWIWMFVTASSSFEAHRSRYRQSFRLNHRSEPPSSPRRIFGNMSTSPLPEVNVTVTKSSVTTLHPTLPPTPPRARRPNPWKILEGEGEVVLPMGRAQNPPAVIVARLRVEPVSAVEFRRRLRTARSYRDVLRIFIRSAEEERLRDEDIDDFITSLHMTSAAVTGDVGVANGNGFPQASQVVLPGSYSRQSTEESTNTLTDWQVTMNHFTEMEQKGECRQPIAKFIHVRHHEHARPDSTYVPECTVVYRCQKEYGCCNSTSECGVKTSTLILRSFWEFTCPPGSNCTEYQIPAIKKFGFVNHTECECKPVKQLPRCQLCPPPFEITGREFFHRCNCTCDPQNEQCLEISAGRSPLNSEQVSCVSQSNCERPFCLNGEYDVETGYCPCPSETPDCRNNSLSQGQDQVQGHEEEASDDDEDDDYATADDRETTIEEQTTQTTTETTPTITVTNIH